MDPFVVRKRGGLKEVELELFEVVVSSCTFLSAFGLWSLNRQKPKTKNQRPLITPSNQHSDCSNQVRLLDRLGYVLLITRGQCALAILARSIAGQCDRRSQPTFIRRRRPQLANKLITVLVRHSYIANHYIRQLSVKHAKRLLRRLRRSDTRAVALQHRSEKLPRVVIIFN